ncbi:MAG: DPP IV N-terminal domain-containing protein [Bacteroidales bacterium]|nr:DPP IV N-terminal domain-containing protein [Candidatus Liminaster caballi]
MKLIKTLIALAAILSVVINISAAEKLTIKSFRSGEYSARSASTFRSTADGKHYTAITPDGRAVVKYQYSNGAAVDTLLNLDNLNNPDKLDLSKIRISGYEINPEEERMLIYANPEYIYRRSFKADYFYFVISSGGVRRNNIRRLTEGKVQAATLGPDGRQAAFVRGNNLFLVKIMSASIEKVERQVTEDGEWGKVINGTPDWVYEEEFSMNQAYCWSPDSKYLCYLKFDESQVKEYPLPLYKGAYPERSEYELYPGWYSYKYPVAGEVNSTVTAWSYDIFNRKNKQLDVPCDPDGYMMRLSFTNDPSKLAVMTFNRHQSDFRMYFVSPSSGVSHQAVQDTNAKYVNDGNMDMIRFYDDGFTFVSEKSGFRHLYYYSMGGTQLRQITKGNFDVTNVYGYDPKTKTAYVQVAYLGEGASMPAELTRGIYKIDAKGQMIPLFNGGKDGQGCRGTHSAAFSQGFIYMQHFYSDAETPTRVTLETVRDLKVIKVMEDNADYRSRISSLGMSKREFFQFTTPEGHVLNGYLTKPHNFDSNKKYPVLMEQYGGPGSQQVLDNWKYSWEQFLNQEGYVVACVDGRGTGARGAEWERQTYCELGVRESQDQLYAGQYVASLSYTDPARMAIWGWSFGGYNTLMAMCGGNDVYKIGMAVAPVTDFKFYDTVYTERYMRTPQENAEGYNKASVLERARNLKGQVLVICGTADDNVHPQNTYELTEVWVQNDIDFDMHVYTNRDHFIRGGNTSSYIYNQLFKYLKKNL